MQSSQQCVSKSDLAVKLKTCTGNMFGSNLGHETDYAGISRRFHHAFRQILGEYLKLAYPIHHLLSVVHSSDATQPDLQTPLNKLHTPSTMQG